ncbi:MAG: hypothetical protein HFJ69_03000 [Enterorhabdus sp.]|jgi:DNA-binding CsgD family transcriptional regulator|nr:hypothetical protein [Enterorhabdus sp.]
METPVPWGRPTAAHSLLVPPQDPCCVSGDDGQRRARRSSAVRSDRIIAAALGCIALGCLLAGAAGCLALGAPAPQGLGQSAVIIGATAMALGLVGVGALLARRGRALRLAESRREAEAERLRRRLDAFGLTPREVTVAQLILEHRCYQNIADQLGLSPRTVQFHASNIFRKASVERRRAFEHLLLTAEGESAAPSTGPYEIIPRLRP